jgi:hypothetical protein
VETALYFPYMQVPESAWFTRILLYWDRAATIIPAAALEQQLTGDHYMNTLRREGLLSFVEPANTIWLDPDHHDAFRENFLKAVDTYSFAPVSSSRYTRVHANKMVWSLFSELERRGLATTEPEDLASVWWHVEPGTANLYMIFLATAISSWQSQHNDETCPVTDASQAIEWLAPAPTAVESQLSLLRYRLITELLPAPSATVPAQKLRKFKEDHHDQLQRLRRYLDLKLVELVDVDDKATLRIRERLIREEVADDVSGLREQMERKRWPKVVLCGFGGIVATGLAVSSAVVTGGASALALGLAAGSGIVSGTPPVLDALRSTRSGGRAPLAYAALAARDLGAR